MTRDPIEHEIGLSLASGAMLTLIYFFDREQRWIFAYHYRGERGLSEIRLTAEYTEGVLAPSFVLSMHVIIPSRLGQRYFAGVDISTGAKTYIEFTYRLCRESPSTVAYRLVEICKGACERVSLDPNDAARGQLIRQIDFPFPIPDRIEVEGRVRVPFRLDNGEISHFDLPARTLRC